MVRNGLPIFGDPGTYQRKEDRRLRWARVAIVVLGITQISNVSVGFYALPRFNNWSSEFRTDRSLGIEGVPHFPVDVLWLLVPILLAFAAAIVMMLFIHVAAKHARNLSLPAALSPAWGAWGWIIPIVSFWFPYWALRDCLPPNEDKSRRNLLKWWLFYWGTNACAYVATEVYSASSIAGFIFLAIVIALAITTVLFGIRGLDTVNKTHQKITSMYENRTSSAGGYAR